MTVSEFANKNGLSAICLPEGEREIEGAYVGDLLSFVMGKAQSGDAWVTIMSNQNVLAVAALTDVACVIFAEGVKPDDALTQTAKEKGINLLACDKDAYGICLMLSACL